MSPRRYSLIALAILIVAAVLRVLWLTADPPTSLGIVWHDEGAWTHSARNAALWGDWITDGWNPVFVAPVFTALEYGSFELFGVGLWQARLVPAISGLVAVALVMVGLRAIASSRAALIGGLLLATDFTWVMWNRAALMESTMTAFIVSAWAAYVMAQRRPILGVAAGAAAVLAWFTKAAAAFFVAAIVADAVMTIAIARLPALRASIGAGARSGAESRAAVMTLIGMAVAAAAAIVFFAAPYWVDYEFANWQMAVARKPTYDAGSFLSRASWLPVVQDFFLRLWPVFVAALLGALACLARWRTARPGERLLVLWILLGLLELVVHDAGNERRYVMFIPAIVALASILVTAEGARLPEGAADWPWRRRLLAVPIVAAFAYLTAGALLRLVFADALAAGDFKGAVRSSAAVAILMTAAAVIFWRPMVATLSGFRLRPRVLAAIVAVLALWHVGQYARWAAGRTDVNYRASIALGDLLPPGTLVHGKLANGLALENRIRPVFIGRDFANYHDRLSRDDVRYILTYELPREGYESQPGLIGELLAHYPQRRVVATFDVEETPGADRAVLIDKHPGSPAPGPVRARD